MGITMKFAFVVCFAALAAAKPDAKADAKADPWYTYGYGAYPYAYGGYRTYGYGFPHVNGYYGKRSADAEPEADPAVLYSAYGAYGAYPYAYSGLYHSYAGY